MVAPALKLTNLQVAMLLALGAPCILVHMLDYVSMTSDASYRKDLQCFEIFAGTSGVYKAFRRRGLAAARYDVDLDKDSMDFTSVLGLLVALQYVLRMAPGSLLYSGLPCSLHVWIARGSSLKTRCNPRGNLLKSCVREANLIACRFSMVVLVCLVRQIWHLTEQPGSSVARHLPYLELALHPDRMMMGFQSSLCQYFWMGLFGHRSLKRSMAFGTSCWAHMLSLQARLTKADREEHRWSSAGNTKVTRNRQGKVKNVSGGPKLKETQSYPSKFCSRVCSLHKTWCLDTNSVPAIPDRHQLEHGPHNFADKSIWDDAQLEDLLKFIQQEMLLEHFVPRSTVPLQTAPISHDQVGVYFSCLNAESGPKRKRGQ
ncbi:unnamed protein product [Cladocopium goreaui]|uniref:Uncharacterized protein n=1 Tax=Cladocopium goreaui TaxID=2562237 RepID=A0A9P1G9A6_9DINO|nr:unnamed protein product [Cladocopium goreaui]